MRRLNRDKTPADFGLGKIATQIKVLEELKGLVKTPEFAGICNLCVSARPGLEPSFSLDNKEIRFSLTSYGQDSFDTDEVTRTLASIEKLDPDKNVVNDYPSYHNRVIVAQWEYDDDFRIILHYEIYVKSDSTTCVRVKVGEKMVAQPIYEMRCAAPVERVPDEALPAPVFALEGKL